MGTIYDHDEAYVSYESRDVQMACLLDTGLTDFHHMHREIEIVYVLEGATEAYADNNRCVLHAGDLFIAFPNQIHFYNTLSPTGRYAVLIGSADLLYGMKSDLIDREPEQNALTLPPDSPIRPLIDRLPAAMAADYSATRLTGIFCLLMSELLPLLTLRASTRTDHATLRSILDYCTQHFTEPVTLETAADALHLSKYYISRLMNERIRIGFCEYIQSMRVRFACDMLMETDRRISEISETAGFGTIRSFNRAFRESTGMTPLDYRRQHAGQRAKPGAGSGNTAERKKKS